MSTSAPLRSFPYAIVDVFAEHPLEGNMLAVFTDARGLSTDQMQALARETNLAETTFILPADDPAHEQQQGIRVRIFTTQEELPFAGHPTLGTASWLYWHHPTLRGAEAITLDLKGGPVTVRFREPAAGEQGVYGTMKQHDPSFGSIHDLDEIARTLNIPRAEIDDSTPIQTVSTGLAFCMVPLRSLEALERLEVPQAAAQRYLDAHDAKFFYVFAPSPNDPDSDFHARMQFYNGEDPATGSASGCVISYLVRYARVPSGLGTRLKQGIQIRRPSHIFVRASLTNDNVSDVFVGGRTIPVASGSFSLP